MCVQKESQESYTRPKISENKRIRIVRNRGVLEIDLKEYHKNKMRSCLNLARKEFKKI